MAKLRFISTALSGLRNFAKTKAFKISVISIVSLLVLFFAVKYYLELREKTRDPYDFLPDNPLAIMHVNNVQEFVSFLGSNNLFSDFEELLSSRSVRQSVLYFDSLFSTKALIQEAWYEGPLLIGSHYAGSDKYEIIFIKPLPHPNYKSRVYQFFETNYETTETLTLKGSGENAKKIKHKHGEMYLCISDGICIFSSSVSIIESSLKSSQSKNPIHTDEAFQDVKSGSGKTCMANIFVNYRFIHRFVSQILNSETLQSLEVMKNFAVWSGYDIHSRDNKLFATGFTSTKGMNHCFLDVFAETQPQGTDIVDVLPQTTLSFIWLGFDDYLSHREAYKHYLGGQDALMNFNNNLTNLKRRTGVQNINDLIFPYLDNQMALFSIPGKNPSSDMQTFAIFKIKDASVFKRHLGEISKITDKTNKSKADTATYRNYKISSIEADYMLFDLFGKMFRSIEKTYYTVYDDYWIVGNSQDAVKEYLNQILSGRTLSKQQFYDEFSQSVSAEANVYIYAAPRRITSELQSWFGESYTEKINQSVSEFNKFEGVGIQFSGQGNLHLSTVTFFRTEEALEEGQTGWEISLDGQVASGPWFVNVAEQTTKNIVLFDAFNSMYFVSDKGEVLWKIPLSERPVSDVFSIDIHKNGKYQYAFSSDNQLFVIDRNGKHVEGFPMKFPVQAAGPVSVFDYEKDREYRFVFVGIDNVIYNYTTKGEETSGWEKPQIETSASHPAKHVVLVNTDAIVVKGNDNQLYFFTRRGVPLLKLDEFYAAPYSNVYPAARLCRCFLTTTADGQLAKIGLNGEIEYQTIHEAGPGHVFLFEDIDTDGQQDFIFIEKGKAYFFGQDGSVISGVDIASDAGRKAGYVNSSPFGPLVYVFSSDGSEMYLANKSGRILPEQSYKASNNADFHVSSDNTSLVLTTASGNSLFLYVIE